MWGETQICQHDLITADNAGCETLNTERERLNWFFSPPFLNLFTPAEPTTRWLITAQRTPPGETLTLFGGFLYISSLCLFSFYKAENMFSSSGQHFVPPYGELCCTLSDWWVTSVGRIDGYIWRRQLVEGREEEKKQQRVSSSLSSGAAKWQKAGKSFRTPEDWAVIGWWRLLRSSQPIRRGTRGDMTTLAAEEVKFGRQKIKSRLVTQSVSQFSLQCLLMCVLPNKQSLTVTEGTLLLQRLYGVQLLWRCLWKNKCELLDNKYSGGGFEAHWPVYWAPGRLCQTGHWPLSSYTRCFKFGGARGRIYFLLPSHPLPFWPLTHLPALLPEYSFSLPLSLGEGFDVVKVAVDQQVVKMSRWLTATLSHCL